MTDNPLTEQSGHIYRVDKFAVPDHARSEFLAKVEQTHELLRTLPGFVQDLVLEQSGGPGEFNFVTIVEWDSPASIENAKAAVSAMHQEIDFNPQEMFSRLGIRADVGNYQQATPSVFDSAYINNNAPWVIGEPQPAVVALERDGWIHGTVLDVGCGTGEHTIYLARLGYQVLGIDASVPGIEHARANADRHGVEARFAVSNVLQLGAEQYDTILDSALFHIFDPADRASYVANLRAACRPGGLVHVLALSDEGPGFGPEISDSVIREAFSEGWQVEEISPDRYFGVATSERHVTELGLQKGERVELPAWLARIRRV